MPGIYFHIPFCKQACHYCNFHFSTSLRYRKEMINAMASELEGKAEMEKTRMEMARMEMARMELAKVEMAQMEMAQMEMAHVKINESKEDVETIYFGGGTPSLLSADEIKRLMDIVYKNFSVSPDAEITLEANPDDINRSILKEWRSSGINRLSLGIQSFRDEDLTWMNRAHNGSQAIECIKAAKDEGFDNFSADLIFGTPTLTDEAWKENVDRLLELEPPHIAAYALTVEPFTPLNKMIALKKKQGVDPGKQATQFLLLMDWLEANGYEHYEISNFCKPGKKSIHNSSYWNGVPYIGIGPSAHSFDGEKRSWNISNNNKYIEGINNGVSFSEHEILSFHQRLNEYIMTSLRTNGGLSLLHVEEIFGEA